MGGCLLLIAAIACFCTGQWLIAAIILAVLVFS